MSSAMVEQAKAQQQNNHFSKPDAYEPDANAVTIGQAFNKIDSTFEQKKNKPGVNDTMKRVTFMCDNQLADKLDALCKLRGHGFKVAFLNGAVEAFLKIHEDESAGGSHDEQG